MESDSIKSITFLEIVKYSEAKKINFLLLNIIYAIESEHISINSLLKLYSFTFFEKLNGNMTQ